MMTSAKENINIEDSMIRMYHKINKEKKLVCTRIRTEEKQINKCSC